MMMLRTIEAAEYIGLKKSTLEAWRVRGDGPVFCKMNKAVRYKKTDLDEFINGRRCTSTGSHTEAETA